MNLQWFLAVVGVVLAAVAILWARHVTKRLERLSQSYWELRYEHGQLAARLKRLEPPDEEGAEGAEPKGPGLESAGPGLTRQQATFVPLSSLKK